MTNFEQSSLYRIAENNIASLRGRGDLKSRGNDDDDFIDLSVVGLQSALEAAYKVGAKKRKS